MDKQQPWHSLLHSTIPSSFNEAIKHNYDHYAHTVYTYTYMYVSNLVGSFCCTTVNKGDGNVVGGHLGRQLEISLIEIYNTNKLPTSMGPLPCIYSTCTSKIHSVAVAS